MKTLTAKKSTVSLLLLALVTMGLGASPAQARDYCGPALWNQVKLLARNCSEKLKHGRGCAEIRIYSGRSAAFVIGGAVYRVRMEESAFSDGGDLDDVYIDRDDGCQLERKNVPAYGDIVAALAR